MDTENVKKIAVKVSVTSIIGNVALSVIKLIAGVIGKSNAMISDAVHSASDVFSTIVVIIGVNLSSKKSDKGHQYGHERLECIAALLLAAILFATGIGIGYNGIEKIFFSDISALETPTSLALGAAILSIIVKEAMYWYTIIAAKKIKSDSLKADAWHHRSDAMSSIGSFIGILGAQMGFPILDPIASIIICLLIIKASFDIVKDSLNKLTDRACDEKTNEKMKEIILSQDGVLELDMLKTRLFGSRIYVDVEISADGNLTLYAAHKIAEIVHDSIENSFPDVKHCMVHVNPYQEKSKI